MALRSSTAPRSLSGTIFEPSSSKSDFPMLTPLRTFLKVKAMPPPMIISSTCAMATGGTHVHGAERARESCL